MTRIAALDQNVGAAKRKTPSVEVTCGECGERFDLSTRNAFAARVRGEAPICFSCRNPPKPLSAEERLALRNWWLSRYSRAELEELAFGLWPSLVASTVDATNGPEGHRIDSPVLRAVAAAQT